MPVAPEQLYDWPRDCRLQTRRHRTFVLNRFSRFHSLIGRLWWSAPTGRHPEMTDLQNEIISPSSLRIYPKKKDLLTFSLDSRKSRELLGSCPPIPKRMIWAVKTLLSFVQPIVKNVISIQPAWGVVKGKRYLLSRPVVQNLPLGTWNFLKYHL